jgi:hypothetical protein
MTEREAILVLFLDENSQAKRGVISRGRVARICKAMMISFMSNIKENSYSRI